MFPLMIFSIFLAFLDTSFGAKEIMTGKKRVSSESKDQCSKEEPSNSINEISQNSHKMTDPADMWINMLVHHYMYSSVTQEYCARQDALYKNLPDMNLSLDGGDEDSSYHFLLERKKYFDALPVALRQEIEEVEKLRQASSAEYQAIKKFFNQEVRSNVMKKVMTRIGRSLKTVGEGEIEL